MDETNWVNIIFLVNLSKHQINTKICFIKVVLSQFKSDWEIGGDEHRTCFQRLDFKKSFLSDLGDRIQALMPLVEHLVSRSLKKSEFHAAL